LPRQALIFYIEKITSILEGFIFYFISFIAVHPPFSRQKHLGKHQTAVTLVFFAIITVVRVNETTFHLFL
jgi:hypothetical protein